MDVIVVENHAKFTHKSDKPDIFLNIQFETPITPIPPTPGWRVTLLDLDYHIWSDNDGQRSKTQICWKTSITTFHFVMLKNRSMVWYVADTLLIHVLCDGERFSNISACA